MKLSVHLAVLAVAGTATAQTTLRDLEGAVAGDFFGLAVSTAGDIDGDGYDDVAIGVRGDDTGGAEAGAMRVLSGQTGEVLLERFGNSSYDYFGLSVAGVGDVDGDGVPDIAVGAPRDDSHIAGSNSGSVFVYSGADGSQILHVRGDSPGEEFGRFVDAAGDVNEDGFADFVVGAPFADDNGTDSGSAHIVSGRDGSILLSVYGAANEDEFGRSLGGVGDTNGDGIPDFAVGARLHDADGKNNAGAAYLFSGADGSLLHSWLGNAADDQLGQSVQGAGDVDADGFADVVVGAFLVDGDSLDCGQAIVYSGATGAAIHTFEGPGFGWNLGRAVDTAGDVNGDGHADLLIGADRFDFGRGAAVIYSGADGSEMFRVEGYASEDLFGHAVAFAGDVDADGFADILVAGYKQDGEAGNDVGGVRLFTSDALGTPARLRSFGRACAGADGKLPQIGVPTLPNLGAVASVTLRAALPDSAAYLVFGFENPIELTEFGAPGCVLTTYPLVSATTTTGPRGRAAVSLPVPVLPELVGLDLAAQWVSLDPTANDLGAVTSTSVTMFVGELN